MIPRFFRKPTTPQPKCRALGGGEQFDTKHQRGRSSSESLFQKGLHRFLVSRLRKRSCCRRAEFAGVGKQCAPSRCLRSAPGARCPGRLGGDPGAGALREWPGTEPRCPIWRPRQEERPREGAADPGNAGGHSPRAACCFNTSPPD